MSEEFAKRLQLIESYDLPDVVRKAADDGSVTKAELGEFLNRRALQLKKSGESVQQSYAHNFTSDGPTRPADDPAGAEVYRVYRAMSGLDEHGAAVMKAIKKVMPPGDDQTPLGKLQALGADIQKRMPHLTKDQAVAAAIETPEGMALYKADKAIRLGGAYG